MRHESHRPIKDAPVIDAVRTLATQCPRQGYRRIRILLQRQGMKISLSCTHRILRCAVRPHSSVDHLTRHEFKQQYPSLSQPAVL